MKKRNFLLLEYDGKNKIHNFLFLLTAVLLLAALFFVRDVPREAVDFKNEDLLWQSQYIKQLDAFLKGQLHIDIEPSRELLGLENPYDRDARDAVGAFYLWDHAFYGGKYYSYFGIAPILTVYLPFYLMTGEAPGDALATLLLAFFAVIFLALAYREAVIRFAKGANLWLFLFGLCAFAAVSGVYTCVFLSDVYNIPVVSALGCAMAFAFYALRAMRTENAFERAVLLVLAAVSLALTVLSRPSAAMLCMALFPIFAEYAAKNGRKALKKTASAALSFALPLTLCAVAVMVYNAARFSSPFDFGADYQLTVNDISKNTAEPTFLYSAFYSYFLYPFWPKESFPYITMQCNIILPDGARYVFGDLYVGAFAFVLPAALLLCPRLARAERKEGREDKTRNVIALLTAALALFVAFFDFCKGGVNMRYTYDIVPMLSLVGAVIMLSLCAKAKGWRRYAAFALCALAFFAAAYAGMAVIEAFLARM